ADRPAATASTLALTTSRSAIVPTLQRAAQSLSQLITGTSRGFAPLYCGSALVHAFSWITNSTGPSFTLSSTPVTVTVRNPNWVGVNVSVVGLTVPSLGSVLCSVHVTGAVGGLVSRTRKVADVPPSVTSRNGGDCTITSA